LPSPKGGDGATEAQRREDGGTARPRAVVMRWNRLIWRCR